MKEMNERYKTINIFLENWTQNDKDTYTRKQNIIVENNKISTVQNSDIKSTMEDINASLKS